MTSPEDEGWRGSLADLQPAFFDAPQPIRICPRDIGKDWPLCPRCSKPVQVMGTNSGDAVGDCTCGWSFDSGDGRKWQP